jgi:hypothetical protein
MCVKKLLLGLLSLALLGMLSCAKNLPILPSEETTLQGLNPFGMVHLYNTSENLPLPQLKVRTYGTSESLGSHRRDPWVFHIQGFALFNDEGFYQFFPVDATFTLDYDEGTPRPYALDYNLDGIDDIRFFNDVFVWEAEQQLFVYHEALSALGYMDSVCEYTGYLRRRYPNRDEICAGFWICPHAGSGDRSCVMEMFELWTYENEQVQHVGHIRDRATHFAFYVEVAWEGGEWETLQRIIR